MIQLITFHTQRDKSALADTFLLLEALDIPYEPRTKEGETTIFVTETDFLLAQKELQLFLEEERTWPPAKKQHQDQQLWNPSLFLMTALALFYSITGGWSPHAMWFTAGAIDTQAILNTAQYYRLVTALTLHADLSHLLGNCLIGGILLHFFLKSTGAGLGIFALLTSAALANLANIALRQQDHHSVGFSTAIFAILGMQVCISWYHNHRKTTLTFIRSLSSICFPFMAALALFSMLGTAGKHTDIGAHFFGFALGIIWGIPLTCCISHKLQQKGIFQGILFLLSSLLIICSWHRALANF